MVEERVGNLEASARANNFDNISVVQERIRDNTSFKDYPRPDTVLVDIEGWEYIVLRNALEKLTSVSTWIIKVHSELIDTDADEPERAIRAIFEDRGYSVSNLNEWSENNSHLFTRREI